MNSIEEKILRLKKMGARSAFITAVLLLFGLAGLVREETGNWLVLIFKLLAGSPSTQPEMLYSLNGMDILLLALFSVVMAALCAEAWETSRAWSLAAAIMPPAGIVIFLITHSAGRSAFMGAMLVISLVMAFNRSFKWWNAWPGILAGVLLLAGDLAAGQAPLPFLAPFFGAGYLLAVFWLFSVGTLLNAAGGKILHGPQE